MISMLGGDCMPRIFRMVSHPSTQAKQCAQCSSAFEVTEDHRKFLENLSPTFGGKKELIPPSSLCPECRQQRRLAHSNDSKLYHRKCDLTQKQIISIYAPDKSVKVYDAKEWWGDKWDARDYAKPLDFSRPFFVQVGELTFAVPRMSLLVDANENADYVNHSGWDKNCYLCFCTDYSEDCYYCHDTYHCKNAIDCYFTYNSEVCYECVGCQGCHTLFYSQNCTNCSDSRYLYDCTDCKHCFGCTGLRHKEYHWFNEEISKQEYDKRMQEFLELPLSQRKKIWEVFQSILLKFPHRESEGTANENVIGNYLLHCKNAFMCFDSTDLEDCSYCFNVRGAKDCHDIDRWGDASEVCYECLGIGQRMSRIAFCYCTWNGCNDLLYCLYCHKSRDCFGCVGLRNARYCVLNKQYTQEEYETLVPKLIAHMRTHGEWGEYFPIALSSFGYNETVADEFYPLTKEEVLKRGWQWYDNREHENYLGPKIEIPEHIRDVHDDICEKILLCEVTGKPYKIIPQELTFYHQYGIPLPKRCPDQRYRDRMTQRNPRKLWDRTCMKCNRSIKTPYAPDRPEIVYCEACYLATVY